LRLTGSLNRCRQGHLQRKTAAKSAESGVIVEAGISVTFLFGSLGHRLVTPTPLTVRLRKVFFSIYLLLAKEAFIRKTLERLQARQRNTNNLCYRFLIKQKIAVVAICAAFWKESIHHGKDVFITQPKSSLREHYCRLPPQKRSCHRNRDVSLESI
jgi:hypothetical protein